MRTTPSTSFLIAGLLLFVSSGCQTATYRSQAVEKFSAPQLTRLVVTSQNGGITVKRGEGPDIAVTAEIRATSPERANATSIGSDIMPEGTLSIEPVWPDGMYRSGESCSFTIMLPRSASVTLNTSNGPIEVWSMAGDAVAHTSNGRIEFVSHDGSIDAKTSNGEIVIRGNTASTSCTTSNGSVKVDLGQHSTGPVRIETSNGAVELVIGPGFAGTLDARTSNGAMSATVPNARITTGGKNSLRIEMPTPGDASSITTRNGRVTVRATPG